MLVPDGHVSSVRFKRAPESGEGAISWNIEDEIVANAASSEVFLGEIDDLISAEGTEHTQFARAVHGGHVCAVGLRDL